jgi:hypothetical protein
MPEPSVCPDTQHLEQFLAGKLNEGEQKALELQTLQEWRTFWKLEQDGGSVADPVFTVGNVSKRRKVEPESLFPRDFRLTRESAGQGLGADVDRVGPGKPYEDWKNTPNYNKWLEQTRLLLEKK